MHFIKTMYTYTHTCMHLLPKQRHKRNFSSAKNSGMALKIKSMDLRAEGISLRA